MTNAVISNFFFVSICNFFHHQIEKMCYIIHKIFLRNLDKGTSMIIVNTDYISGKEIETIQLVKGSIVFSKNVVRDVFAGLKTLIGGEIAGYSEMMSQARQKATERMMNEAAMIGADAIVNVRYATSNLMASAAEVIAYGTAVRFKK